MKAKLISSINEVVIRGYSLLEDEGIGELVAAGDQMGWPGITMEYERDEKRPGKHTIVIAAPDQKTLFKFLEHAGIPVLILT